MAKKRKLNSKNPKYMVVSEKRCTGRDSKN